MYLTPNFNQHGPVYDRRNRGEGMIYTFGTIQGVIMKCSRFHCAHIWMTTGYPVDNDGHFENQPCPRCSPPEITLARIQMEGTQ